MNPLFFIGSIALLLGITLFWGAKTLPREKWQILATMPRQKQGNGQWKGLNLTFYGLLSANAYTFAVIMFFILGASANIPVQGLCVLILALLGTCMPAAKIIARIVEKKKGTLTVGGAVFFGTLTAPWLIWLVNKTVGQAQGFHMNPTIVLSAVCIAYAYGEGLGRLACISFGCCYGKPLHRCSPFVQRLFADFHLVFWGKTKKIAYASGLDGEKVIPIQIITAVLYSSSALLGTWLFLNNHFAAAFMETLAMTQVWRIVSEFFRADFRGDFTITPYQIMAALALVYSVGVVLVFPAPRTMIFLEAGLESLWNPWMLLAVQSIWVASFVYTGRSSVTSANISFSVEKSKI